MHSYKWVGLLEILLGTQTCSAVLSPITLPRMPESLEQLELLPKQEVVHAKVRRDGIHSQSLRYLSLTPAAYGGEEGTIRCAPRDIGESVCLP